MKDTKYALHPVSLFGQFFKVGMIGFGGGSALIPVIEREIAGDGKPMGEKDFLKHTVIANITPGALPVKLGATCGYQLGGPLGGLVGAYGAMLPGVFLTVLILSLFSLMGPQVITLFNYASVGISLFIIMLLINYTLKTCCQDQTHISWTLCLISFLLTCGKEVHQIFSEIFPHFYEYLPPPLFDISTIDLILIAFIMIFFRSTHVSRVEFVAASLLCLAYFFCRGKLCNQFIPEPIDDLILGSLVCFAAAKAIYSRKTNAQNNFAGVRFNKKALLCIAGFLILPVAFLFVLFGGYGRPCLSLLGNIGLSTITSFGGGEAYVSVADGFFVQSGYIDATSFYTKLVPVANALPGPILVKIASGIGFLYGSETFGGGAGWIFAASCAVLAVGVCCSLSLVILQMYEAVEHSAFITNLRNYILPVICGMLLSTSCSMLYEASKITSQESIPTILAMIAMIFGVGLLRYLHKKFHIHDLLLLLGSSCVSLVSLTVI